MKDVRQQRKLPIRVWISLTMLVLIVLSSLMAPWLANGHPLWAKSASGTIYPAFFSSDQGISYDTTTAIFPILPGLDRYQSDDPLPPFSMDSVKQQFYPLGTTADRQDLLSAILHGGKKSLSVAFFTLIIILFLSFTVGGIAGYWGNKRMKFSFPRLLFLLICLPLIYFYGFYIWRFDLQEQAEVGMGAFALQFLLCLAITMILLVGAFQLSRPLLRLFPTKQFFPLDSVLIWIMQLIQALPGLLVIITLTLILRQKSLTLVMVLLALISWPGLALYIRNELSRERRLPYIDAAEGLGLPPYRILTHHLFPNIIGPLIGEMILLFSSIIIVESSLAFLGLIEQSTSWGSLIIDASPREQMWWQALFPGIWLFTTVICLQVLGEHFRQRLTRQTLVE